MWEGVRMTVQVHPADYANAQAAMAQLKGAVQSLLTLNNSGLRNVDVGRALGIYRGHVGHPGHLSRTVLEMLKEDGVAEQREDRRWYSVVFHAGAGATDEDDT